MKLHAPAFALKKSVQGVLRFSESGNLLAQVTSRVLIWNVPERKERSSIKVISNEHFVAFHEPTQRCAIKNSNGELAFVDLTSGDLISKTGKFAEFRMGCQPWFIENGDFLLDGGSGGSLTVWSTATSTPSQKIDLGCHSVGEIAYSSTAERFACLCSAGGEAAIALLGSNLSPDTITILSASSLGVNPSEWWEAAHLVFSPCGTKLALTAKTQARENRTRVYVLDLASKQLVTSIEAGDDANGWATSLSWSESGYLALVYHANPWRPGMPAAEYEAVKKSRTWESVHFIEAENGRLVELVYLPGVNRAVFRPGSNALALNCTQFPGAFLPDFRSLSAFAAAKAPEGGES